jgi:YfiH family protein
MILPTPDDSFEWRETAFGPALACLPLEEVAAHLFTSRAWALGASRDSREGWVDIAATFGLPVSALVRLTQVHGRQAIVADEPRPASTGNLPEADIVLSSRTETVVAVQGADCVPLLIADARLGVVAAAHAGWRGLSLGVPRVTVEHLARRYGSHERDLVAAIGPSIGSCCYEVGDDVYQAFAIGGFAVDRLRGWFRDAPAPTDENRSMPGLPPDPRPGHYYFDGWTSAREQLLDAGLDASRVHCARLCTASHADVLCSYRRDGRQAGRIAGAITASARGGLRRDGGR